MSRSTHPCQGAGFKPKVAVVLGSGLGGFAEEVEPVADDPLWRAAGLPAADRRQPCRPAAARPDRRLPVAVLRGRTHYYEFGKADGMRRRSRPWRSWAARRCC
jgi:purine nucleoside phosphorylase